MRIGKHQRNALRVLFTEGGRVKVKPTYIQALATKGLIVWVGKYAGYRLTRAGCEAIGEPDAYGTSPTDGYRVYNYTEALTTLDEAKAELAALHPSAHQITINMADEGGSGTFYKRHERTSYRIGEFLGPR